jgi:hypothetical protein
VADIRNCEQCGTTFAPRREHARFCSAGCRVAWNIENTGDGSAEITALSWSIAAMREATGRLSRVREWDRPGALAVLSEAVWWVTIADATLVRYYPEAYDSALACQGAAERHLVEETLAGLRFVRNQMGNAAEQIDFIRPPDRRSGPGDGGITAWTWQSQPEPDLTALPPRGQPWELRRYQAYESQLASHTVGETFGRLALFLGLAAGTATSVTDASAATAP